MSRVKWLTWLLALSAGLNLFLVGYWVARPKPAGSWRSGRPALERADAVPGLKQMLREQRPELRERRRALALARQAVSDALVAEPFERERLVAAFSALRVQTGGMQEVMHRGLTDLAERLPREDRKRLVRFAVRGERRRR